MTAPLLPLLQAFTGGPEPRLARAPSVQTVDTALQRGLAPVLFHVSHDGPAWADMPRRNDLVGADLAARVVSAETFDVVEQVLSCAASLGIRPLLLKGAATALRYYPSPHLRPMGDVDLLVGTNHLEAIQEELGAIGFREQRRADAPDYRQHHHGVPLWHSQRRVCIEVHTRLYPPTYPLGNDSRFSADTWQTWLVPDMVGTSPTLVMSDELQLIYTATRWFEMLHVDRGVVPLLDVALILRTRGQSLDWDRVCSVVQRSWAIGALRVVSAILTDWALPAPPSEVHRWLEANDQYGSRLTVAALRALATGFLLESPRHRVLPGHAVRTVWGTLTSPRPAWRNFLALLPVLGRPAVSRIIRLKK